MSRSPACVPWCCRPKPAPMASPPAIWSLGRGRCWCAARRRLHAEEPVSFVVHHGFFRNRRMNPHVRLLLLVLCCLPLTAADLTWPTTHTGDQPPAGWEAQTGEGASLRFSAGDLLTQAPPHRHALVSRELGIDGSDAKPLVITAAVAADGARELAGLPTGIAVWWDAENSVHIGLSGIHMDGVERWEPGRRRGWAHWIAGGTPG